MEVSQFDTFFFLNRRKQTLKISLSEILVKAVYLSVDPYMRVILPKMPLNSTVIGEQIGVIIESKNENFPVNAFIWSFFGWRDLTVYRPTTGEAIAGCILPYILPAMDNMPLSSRLSVFGMTGNSAYFGLLEICQPKKGETVVVTGAAGAVGSIVGQIAKIRGCKVIGIAGSDLKCEWLTRELKFDHAINYKSENVIENLRKRAPDGVDCFFDNVGGETSSSVISHMNDHGRIAVCGSISAYNAEDSQKGNKSIDRWLIFALIFRFSVCDSTICVNKTTSNGRICRYSVVWPLEWRHSTTSKMDWLGRIDLQRNDYRGLWKSTKGIYWTLQRRKHWQSTCQSITE